MCLLLFSGDPSAASAGGVGVVGEGLHPADMQLWAGPAVQRPSSSYSSSTSSSPAELLPGPSMALSPAWLRSSLLLVLLAGETPTCVCDVTRTHAHTLIYDGHFSVCFIFCF